MKPRNREEIESSAPSGPEAFVYPPLHPPSLETRHSIDLFLIFTLILYCALSPLPAAAAGTQTEIPYREIKTPPGLGMQPLPDEDVKYYGILQTQDQFNALWNMQENTATDFPALFSWMIPPAPEIDFEKYTVLWFSNGGARASFVTLKKILATGDSTHAITIYLDVVHSDFGSRQLNLWRIPKTTGPVVFKETHIYDRGP